MLCPPAAGCAALALFLGHGQLAHEKKEIAGRTKRAVQRFGESAVERIALVTVARHPRHAMVLWVYV